MMSGNTCAGWFVAASLAALAGVPLPAWGAAPLRPASAVASGFAPGAAAEGAIDGDRFSAGRDHQWRGAPGAGTWWWQVQFAAPRVIGAILQVHGDHPTILRNAPRRYVWRASEDGERWRDLRGTEVPEERRLFRLHRLQEPCPARYLRITIDRCHGESPTLREVEFFPDTRARIDFPDWIIAVNTFTHDRTLPGPTQAFANLIRQSPGWEHAPLQQVWLGDFDLDFVATEPYPVCAFLSGNILEWCQQDREPWRGVQRVLQDRNLPIWAACGGAQALAILQETGVDRPWDCPRCRDPQNPKLPVYSHIGHTGPAQCGDYSRNVAERGRFQVRLEARDPAFAGLPEVFEIMESHVGQIAYVPPGWIRVVTKGPGALTENQCLRVADRYIYAAQFHMEAPGTPETSRTIMSNFLRLAKAWGGYNPRGKPVPVPASISP